MIERKEHLEKTKVLRMCRRALFPKMLFVVENVQIIIVYQI